MSSTRYFLQCKTCEAKEGIQEGALTLSLTELTTWIQKNKTSMTTILASKVDVCISGTKTPLTKTQISSTTGISL
jgi:hypothetical protein